MARTTATILIPDISGFTEFMTNTELSHSSFAISTLINTIISTVGDEYEISEIEGDAVLMFKRGPAPGKKEIQDICLKIFNAFHFQRSWMQKHVICPCKACLEIDRLTLKFIAHHGAVGEIRAGGFTKLSGVDVIVAHRLLKNSVPSNEYVLLSEKLLQQSIETPEADRMEWAVSSDDYSSIGKVEYRFALLNEQRKKAPEAPEPQVNYPAETTASYEIPIAANYQEAYMIFMNVPNRPEWLHTLKTVEQQIPAAFVGSVHYCSFDDYQAIVSPLQMRMIGAEQITYAESCLIEALGLSLVYEASFKYLTPNSCILSARIINTGPQPIAEETSAMLLRSLQNMAESLNEFCENAEEHDLH
jgi:hypothetical protein